MSIKSLVIRTNSSIKLDASMMKAAKTECEQLDLNTSDSHKVFEPGKACREVIGSIKKQVNAY